MTRHQVQLQIVHSTLRLGIHGSASIANETGIPASEVGQMLFALESLGYAYWHPANRRHEAVPGFKVVRLNRPQLIVRAGL